MIYQLSDVRRGSKHVGEKMHVVLKNRCHEPQRNVIMALFWRLLSFSLAHKPCEYCTVILPLLKVHKVIEAWAKS